MKLEFYKLYTQSKYFSIKSFQIRFMYFELLIWTNKYHFYIKLQQFHQEFNQWILNLFELNFELKIPKLWDWKIKSTCVPLWCFSQQHEHKGSSSFLLVFHHKNPYSSSSFCFSYALTDFAFMVSIYVFIWYLNTWHMAQN